MSLHRYGVSPSAHRGTNDARRSLNTCSFQNSAYDRIFSSKNIITQVMPGFLIQHKSKEGISKMDLLRISISGSPAKASSRSDLSTSPTRQRVHNSEDMSNLPSDRSPNKSYPKTADSLIRDIFNLSLPSDEVILTFHKRKLTRADLICFKEGNDLNESIIDCYMSIMKISDRSKPKISQKVLVLNTEYSKLLFQVRSKIPKPKMNIFDSNLMIIPIFDGYWALATVNLITGVAHYYDGLAPDKDISSISVIIKRFLINSNINGVPNINENFLNFEHVRIVPNNMSLKDSGIYICKIAKQISHSLEIGDFDFRALRKDMLNNLIRVYLKHA